VLGEMIPNRRGKIVIAHVRHGFSRSVSYASSACYMHPFSISFAMTRRAPHSTYRADSIQEVVTNLLQTVRGPYEFVDPAAIL
jgi:hypothetical protein